MSEPARWIVAILVAAALVALVLVARGERQRDVPVESPVAAIVVTA
jgi:hypothetical protein